MQCSADSYLRKHQQGRCPSSCLHPAPRDNSLPFGQAGRQAVEGTAMDVFCLLSNERWNVTEGLSAGPSQPSIHTCGISTVYQTSGRQLCSTLPASLQYVPLLLFLITNKQQDPGLLRRWVRLSPPPPHPTAVDLTQTSQMKDGGELGHK
ncbi:hypothetical protein EYF80_013797 [Liparis tanakae]|uniref:Uncharacterized protein n=1 Tax=Liparis tanakae TaxID=230148 RepID=A0A4Z2IF05_9TELE|nr:hypothetical protein EYF80_013797 [Liparis tanakae]